MVGRDFGTPGAHIAPVGAFLAPRVLRSRPTRLRTWIVAWRLAGGRGGVDGHGAGGVEHLVGGGPLTWQVALAAVDELVHADAVLADLVGAGGRRVPPDRSRVVDAEIVVVRPVALVAVGQERLADRQSARRRR